MGELIDAAKSQHSIEQEIKGLGQQLGGPFLTRMNGDGRPSLGGGIGDAFIQSKGWQQIADPGTRPQTWSTGAVEVPSFQTKAGTLFEGAGGQVADVFASGQTNTSQLRYIVEGTATNAAAGVAEGGTKPASDIAMATVDEPVKKIATVLTVSDELLEDATTVQTYLNSRLALFVTLEEERQLLRGAGTNELVGMFGRSGINQYTKAAADDNTTALAKVIANTRGSSFLQPDAVIMHPTNWLNSRLLRDGTGGTVGQYFGGGPFGGAYGNGGAAGLFGEQIWNTRVVLSTIVGPGTALVGSFGQAAQLHRRGGPTVEATNSHASYFQNNLVMLRAEERLALCVYRPVAFTEVRGLV
jgi:HK97 family phage major capsid protein